MKNIIEVMNSRVKAEDLVNIIKAYTDETVENIDFTAHLEAWAENKQHIFELFGNQLTVERPVETSLPPSAIKKKLKDFLSKDFSEKKYSLISVFLKGLQEEEIQTNILDADFKMFDTTFKKGMKISKCFRSLIKKDYLEEANIKYSMFLQSLKAKGMAVLSIDPKDFLTMSANASGWRSCHAPDGEFRVGNVAYMMDNCSVISYIKATEDVQLNSGTIHTNKIWRQIVLISPEDKYAIQCRQYPNSNDSNVHTIALMLQDMLKKSQGIEYNQISCEVDDYHFNELQTCHSDYDQCYYNDIEHSAFNTGYLVKPKDKSLLDMHSITNKGEIKIPVVGAEVPCLCGCGKVIEDSEHYFVENTYIDDYDYDYYN